MNSKTNYQTKYKKKTATLKRNTRNISRQIGKSVFQKLNMMFMAAKTKLIK